MYNDTFLHKLIQGSMTRYAHCLEHSLLLVEANTHRALNHVNANCQPRNF